MAPTPTHPVGLATDVNPPLRCPHCRFGLFISYHGGIPVQTCPSCNGCWLDHSAASLLLKNHLTGFSAEELLALHRRYQHVAKVEDVKYISCPVCQQRMKRKNWGSYSGVIVDTCSKHGTWFDDLEFSKVEEFVILGGIEYEKMMKPQEKSQYADFKVQYPVGFDFRHPLARYLKGNPTDGYFDLLIELWRRFRAFWW